MSEIHLEYISCCVSRAYKASLLVTKDVARGNERRSQIFCNRFDLFIGFKTVRLKNRQSMRIR
jgi:hypothetical protein